MPSTECHWNEYETPYRDSCHTSARAADGCLWKLVLTGLAVEGRWVFETAKITVSPLSPIIAFIHVPRVRLKTENTICLQPQNMHLLQWFITIRGVPSSLLPLPKTLIPIPSASSKLRPTNLSAPPDVRLSQSKGPTSISTAS